MPSERSLISYHEAGHALLAVHQRIPFRRVRMSAVDGAISGCRLLPGGEIGYLAMLAAGAAAETLVLGGYRPGHDAGVVCSRAFDQASLDTWTGDWDAYKRLRAAVRVSDAAITAIALRVISRDWDTLQALARELSRSGGLAYSEVHAIVRAARYSRAQKERP